MRCAPCGRTGDARAAFRVDAHVDDRIRRRAEVRARRARPVIDWPKDSGAHPPYRTEWWYATGWLETAEHQPLGFQITFFRSNTGKKHGKSAFDPSQLVIAHAALSDPAYGRLAHDQNIARQGFGLAYAKEGNTDVKLDAWRMSRAADGSYTVIADAAGFALHLTFTPTQPPMFQGEGGYSRKGRRRSRRAITTASRSSR